MYFSKRVNRATGHLEQIDSHSDIVSDLDYKIDWPVQLNVQKRINHELRQNGNTKEFIFDIEHVVHELTQGMTLKSGTIIATGTPAGVVMGMNPPQFLKKGDVIECSIEKIGQLINTVQ